jgi:hypothetical protein
MHLRLRRSRSPMTLRRCPRHPHLAVAGQGDRAMERIVSISTISLVALSLAVVLLLGRRWLAGPAGGDNGLTRASMTQALARLGELAQAHGQILTLIVVGGAAMVLRYQARVSTKDVDAFFLTPPERQETRAWAARVARELGLPADWLNDGAKGFMQGLTYGPLLLEAPGIQVYQVGSEQLLAMKLSAWRGPVDRQDATIILAELAPQYASKDALWSAISPFVTELKAQYAFEELWERFYA